MMPNNVRNIQYTIPLPERFLNFLKDKSARNILDVGCGYGRVCFFLRERGYNVVGVDVDKGQIKLAHQESRSQGINGEIGLVTNDAENLAFPDSSFDAATMLGIITLVPKSERSKLMKEVHRVLKPLGYVFVEEFGRTWENPVYSRRYKEDLKVTGELGTITVKDDTGKVLHLGHHFTRQELYQLFRDFRIVEFEEDIFTSYYHKNWIKGYMILAQKKSNKA
jgi:ubiquinone/menaquinone biosynthesis C-methylase UbiE